MSGLQDRATNVTTDETELICALRAGDEDAFMDLVGMYQRSMLHLAGFYVKDAAAAEEVVQETWLAVLHGLNGFEARSSLKTWIFRILVNRAKTRGQREARTIPFSALVDAEIEGMTLPSILCDSTRRTQRSIPAVGPRSPSRGMTCLKSGSCQKKSGK